MKRSQNIENIKNPEKEYSGSRPNQPIIWNPSYSVLE